MPDKPIHRCLVCEAPNHAQLWLAPLDLDETDMVRIIHNTTASPPESLRLATAPERHRLGVPDPERQLWISHHH